MAKEVSEIWVQFNVDSGRSEAALKAISADLKRLNIDAKIASKAMGQVDGSFKMAAGDTTEIITGINNINSQMEKQISLTERLVNSLNKQKRMTKELTKDISTYSKVADRSLGTNARGAAQANRFNSGNFLAQFQDIAVTSAMGMNPMLIAMQQGTQLQYILAQSNAPLKDFVAGLKSAFSGIGLLTIGVTGLVAALIQMVDWTSVAKTTLHALGNLFDFIGDHILTLSAVMLVLIGRFVLLNKEAIMLNSAIAIAAIEKATKGMWAFAKATTAAKLAMAGNWLKANKTFLIITVTVTALAAAFEWLYKKLTGKSIIDSLGDTFHDLAEKITDATDSLQDFNKFIQKGWDDLNNKIYEESLEKLDTRTRVYEKTLHEGNQILAERALKEGKNIELYGEELNKLHELATATADHAAESEKNNEALKAAAEAADAASREVERLAKAWQNLQASSKNKIQDLQMNISLVGAGTYQSTYEKTLADMVRQAESQGINLYGPDNKYEQLQKDAEGIAHLTDEYESLSDKVNFAKSATKGFFSDMRQGLRDGQSAWEAFGNAVSNVLDKILDKIMDIGVDALFSAGYGYGKTSGWWGSETSAMSVPTGKPLMKADGGVFSNGVYTSPTLFKFAKGGKFGIMGEAGPEAVMPLARRSDGSLGVKADGIGGSSPVVVNVINNSNAQARVEQRETSNGTEIDVMIDQLVAEKMGKPGTSSNTALRAFNNQKLIAR